MICPHCDLGIYEDLQRGSTFSTKDGQTWIPHSQICPQCNQPIVFLEATTLTSNNYPLVTTKRFMAYPRDASARPVPADVSDPYRRDFDEAVAVLPLSAKASAALSRRNMQAILRDLAGTKSKDLHDQIEEVISTGKLPSHIAEGLHAVRNIGNFAAHPMKSKSTGEIVDVEPQEAEWNLDVLESLFDFYFVQPAINARRKAEINKKLTELGKPLI